MFRLIAALLACFAFAVPAQAQTWPTKPIRLIVPFPPGGGTHFVSRTVATELAKSTGWTIVVDNKAGADGAIAGADVVKAAPDGYTLLMATNSPMAVAPAMKKNPPYDPVADFTPITDIGRYTFFIVVHPSVPAKTVTEFIHYARANPGKINYATGNTTGIVSTAFFAAEAKIDMVHVPYKGEPQAITDLLGGRVQLLFASSSTSVPQVRDGKLRALATTPSNRSHLEPVFGRSNWKDLYSVIAAGGEYRAVTPDGEVVGKLDARFVYSRNSEEISLGGRSWSMVKCDDAHNIVVVVPGGSELSRTFWTSSGEGGFSPLVCRQVRKIRARGGTVLPISKQEKELMQTVFARIPEGIGKDGLYIVERTGKKGVGVLVFSFSGSRFNRLLSLLLQDRLGGKVQVQYNDFRLMTRLKNYLTTNRAATDVAAVFPELRPHDYALPPEQLFAAAHATAKALSWEIVSEEVAHWRSNFAAQLCQRHEYVGETLFCYSTDGTALMQNLHTHAGLRYLHRPASLEDVFLKLTGRELRD